MSFSQAPAERNFRDYSGPSVPIHLAMVRATPSCFQDPQFVLQVSFTSFPFPTGRLRRKLWQEVVAFPPTSNTGAHTISCGLRHFRLDWASDNQSSPYTTCLIGLWPLVLGLHRPYSQHAIVPSNLSTEGKLLVYPLRFSGLTPTGERGSCATWAQYYGDSVPVGLATGRESRSSRIPLVRT